MAGVAFAALFFAFVLLFGDPNGIFGIITPTLDPALKSKLLNSLAVFGLSCIGIGIWLTASGERQASSAVLPMILAFWLSLTFGFMSVDCRIFTFCERTDPAGAPECSTEYDRQGAHVECK